MVILRALRSVFEPIDAFDSVVDVLIALYVMEVSLESLIKSAAVDGLASSFLYKTVPAGSVIVFPGAAIPLLFPQKTLDKKSYLQ